MRTLIFLVIAFSFFGRTVYADPDSKDNVMAVSYIKQSPSECSCSLRKQHQTKLRIEKKAILNPRK
jgi:hypothetical protein